MMARTEDDEEEVDQTELVLTAFQAAPLAYEDFKGTAQKLPVLDFEKETITLRETLEKKGIRLQVETATSNSLGDFLSQGNKLLHFSGHGHPEYLFIENDHGGAQSLLVNEDLKEWIRAGGNLLKFVFVAACHSRTAGEVFVDAGVQHVVCAEQNEHMLSHVAATVFAKHFYGSLGDGRTIQEAYNLAVQGVRRSPEVARTGLDPNIEAAKFVLLPENSSHEICLFPNSKSRRRKTQVKNKPQPKQLQLLPLPPENFLGRELDMYCILKAFIVGEERLATVTGEQGMGKASFAKAIGHYMAKRQMWGDVLWIPSTMHGDSDNIRNLFSQVIAIMEKHDSTDSFQADQTYQVTRERVVEVLYEKKTVVIVYAADFVESRLQMLSLFLDDLFERTKQVKLLVVLRKDATLTPPRHTGFRGCRDTKVELKCLDLASTLLLFGRNCQHASPVNWSSNGMLSRYNEYPETVVKVLGGCNPTKTIIMAKNLQQDEYKRLVTGGVALSQADFSRVLSSKALESYLATSTPSHDHKASISPQCCVPGLPRPNHRERSLWRSNPLKSQKELQTRFLQSMRSDGKIFRKKASAYIRPAIKWEQITTVIKGKQETQQTVDDDTSMIVCGKAAGEYYVLKASEFLDCYDEKSLKQIPANTRDDHLRELRQAGFCEYQSKRFVWGREVTEEDMRFFRHGADSPDFAYFTAPWGESERVEKGDYLVTQYPTNGKRNDEVYRIERHVFEKTYVDTDLEAEETDTRYWQWLVSIVIATIAVAAAVTFSAANILEQKATPQAFVEAEE